MYCLRCRYCQYWHQLSPEPDEKVREKVEKEKYMEDKILFVFQYFSIFCDCISVVDVFCVIVGEKMVWLLSRTNGDSSSPKEFIECAHCTLDKKYLQTNKQTKFTSKTNQFNNKFVRHGIAMQTIVLNIVQQ